MDKETCLALRSIIEKTKTLINEKEFRKIILS